MEAKSPLGFGYQIQTWRVTSGGCQKLNLAPVCGLACAHWSCESAKTKLTRYLMKAWYRVCPWHLRVIAPCPNDEIDHVLATAAIVLGRVLGTLNCDCARPRLVRPPAEERAPGLSWPDIGVM